MIDEVTQFAVSGGTPGANTDELTLFDSTVAWPGGGLLPVIGIKRFTFGGNNSHAGQLKAYFSTNKGTNWDLYSQTAVAAASSGAMSGPYDFDVAGYSDWKLTWTNDAASAQTTWRVQLHGHTSRQPGA